MFPPCLWVSFKQRFDILFYYFEILTSCSCFVLDFFLLCNSDLSWTLLSFWRIALDWHISENVMERVIKQGFSPSFSFRAGCCPVGWVTSRSRTSARSVWKKFLTVLMPAAPAHCARRNSLTSASPCTWMMPRQLFSMHCCRTRTASLPGWVDCSATERKEKKAELLLFLSWRTC